MSEADAGWGGSGGATATLWRGGQPVYDRRESGAVIGAGASGLAAVKNLREYGFAVDCFERETSVGGAWNWKHARSPVYASTHLISSKPFSAYPDFPMPDDWPDYPHHAKVLAYLERYAGHFGLGEHIWFGTEVAQVEPAEDGLWDVTTQAAQGGGTRAAPGGARRTARYAAVVVANGHNWSPKMPTYDGLSGYRGEVIHASAYKDAGQLRGRKVLVVGAGNSGCDIAVEAAQQAARCWHSSRRGYWYAPKYTYGRPSDQVNDLVLWLRLPLRLRQWLFHRTLRRTVGDLIRFGLPRPDHKIYETHPIANSQLVYHVGHGDITPVPDVERFERTEVVLRDGQRIDPDLVVLATGYLPTFEFLEPEVLGTDAEGRPRPLLHTFVRGYPTLFLTGLVQPDSGLFPISHWQSVAAARWLRLRRTDPARARDVWSGVIAREQGRYNRARVKDSTRHWFEVSHVDYLRALEKLINTVEPANGREPAR